MSAYAYTADSEAITAIENLARHRRFIIDGKFHDDRPWHIPWRQRMDGAQLFERLKAGDHVLMSGAGTFAGPDDFLKTVKDFATLGIVLHLHQRKWMACPEWASLGPLQAPFVEKTVAAIAAANARRRHEWNMRGIARKVLAGLRCCRYPGYGWRWTTSGKRVIDMEECKVAEMIRTWRAAGLSWAEMARSLLLRKIKTKNGCEWSAARVRRVYLASVTWTDETG